MKSIVETNQIEDTLEDQSKREHYTSQVLSDLFGLDQTTIDLTSKNLRPQCIPLTPEQTKEYLVTFSTKN